MGKTCGGFFVNMTVKFRILLKAWNTPKICATVGFLIRTLAHGFYLIRVKNFRQKPRVLSSP
jgi:hypothetical protein